LHPELGLAYCFLFHHDERKSQAGMINGCRRASTLDLDFYPGRFAPESVDELGRNMHYIVAGKNPPPFSARSTGRRASMNNSAATMAH